MAKDANKRAAGKLDNDLKGGAGAGGMTVYPQTKFAQFLSAQWWRRELSGSNTVVAVSPGMIPGSGLFRGSGQAPPTNSPDAKSVPQGENLSFWARTDVPDKKEPG